MQRSEMVRSPATIRGCQISTTQQNPSLAIQFFGESCDAHGPEYIAQELDPTITSLHDDTNIARLANLALGPVVRNKFIYRHPGPSSHDGRIPKEPRVENRRQLECGCEKKNGGKRVISARVVYPRIISDCCFAVGYGHYSQGSQCRMPYFKCAGV